MPEARTPAPHQEEAGPSGYEPLFSLECGFSGGPNWKAKHRPAWSEIRHGSDRCMQGERSGLAETRRAYCSVWTSDARALNHAHAVSSPLSHGPVQPQSRCGPSEFVLPRVRLYIPRRCLWLMPLVLTIIVRPKLYGGSIWGGGVFFWVLSPDITKRYRHLAVCLLPPGLSPDSTACAFSLCHPPSCSFLIGLVTLEFLYRGDFDLRIQESPRSIVIIRHTSKPGLVGSTRTFTADVPCACSPGSFIRVLSLLRPRWNPM